MTNRKKNKPSKVNRNVSQIRFWNRTRYILIALQALLGALVGVCFFLFYNYSLLRIQSVEEDYDYTPSFYELRNGYFDSEAFNSNISNSLNDLVRYVLIRDQMETDGEFDEDKLINVGEFSNRHSQTEYLGPVVYYRLGDLIKWGQKSTGNSELMCSYEFYTAEEYCEFFGLNLEAYILGDEYIEEPDLETDEGQAYVAYAAKKVEAEKRNNVASFETLNNQYLSAEGLKLEEYVNNVEDYVSLVSSVQASASDIYSNYCEYIRFNEYFSEENTNIRYAVSLSKAGSRTLYTNDSTVTKWTSDSKLESIFKGYGTYLYASPSNLGYSTNTRIEYELIKEYVIDGYGYGYPDATIIWFALDRSFPVHDVYYQNYVAFDKTLKSIPWLLSLGAFGMAGFFILIFAIIGRDKKLFAKSNQDMSLGAFDRLPIEIVFLSFILLILVLVLGESILLRRGEYEGIDTLNTYLVLSASLVSLDIFTALVFFYTISKRIICGNFLDGSVLVAISPLFSGLADRLRKIFDKANDNGYVTIRTWGTYILYLMFNLFFVSLILFGDFQIASFAVLMAVDIFTGSFLFNTAIERRNILEGVKKISEGDYSYKINTSKMHGENKELANAINEIVYGLEKAVEISTKDEKLKADLITNVSHDIKTPLTSIINYVDLLKRENIENEKVKKYITVLDEKSQRLKQLTFDLVEASKISSGNISIEPVRLNMNEFIKQAVGEFEEKLEENGLELEITIPKEPLFIMADPRHMWRVLENILNNVCKYALKNTRVYLDLNEIESGDESKVSMALKNISGQKLNIPAEELTERFIRGDVSRSTEGSGLGLSIAKSLTNVQGGEFDIYLDGDLFKITISFEKAV